MEECAKRPDIGLRGENQIRKGNKAMKDIALMPEYRLDKDMTPAEIVRRLKLAFKQLKTEEALAIFARIMTSDVGHAIKVAAWTTIRYSHYWWQVDKVLEGEVMKNPLIQKVFADAVPMRRWMSENATDSVVRQTSMISIRPLDIRLKKLFNAKNEKEFMLVQTWDDLGAMCYDEEELSTVIEYAINALIRFEDGGYEHSVTRMSYEHIKELIDFRDVHGNNLLWYLTYRDDQHAMGGFAAPKNERFLLDIGVDPNSRNDIGLCWNDVRQYVNR